MKVKIIYILCVLVVIQEGCRKEELNVQNPNSPTPENAKTEAGILSLALGAVYQTGFNGITDTKYSGSFLGSSFWFLAPAYHDLMADVISAEAANNITNQVSVPDYVVFDDGSKVTNSAPAKQVVRLNNSRTKAGNNMFYFEWTWMYYLNNACNLVLETVESVPFTGDAATKKNALKAWAYFWKGYAYSRIGSIYYAGLIKNESAVNSGLYRPSAEIIAESDANYNKAMEALNGISTLSDYTAVLKVLIPTQCQTGKGGALTPAMWIHTINTMKARNILANKRVKDMTAADWNNILTLVNNGVTSSDLVFTGRSASAGSFLSATTGSVAAMTTGDPTSTTYKISERLIQEYKTGDQRLANNFSKVTAYLNQKGGFTFSTRYRLLDGGNALSGVQIVSSRTVGAYELYLAATYEENELMKAEANIKLNNIAAGLASVDAVRTYQGSGITAVSGVITDQAQAYEELRRERRTALLFRNVSLYDYRRWGYLDDISAGGGRTNTVVVSSTGVVNTKATINYNFLDYWDVPDDELSLNPPVTGSAPVQNPK
ncbi:MULTISPECIES: RagB/SusD family nutrient uptake outer membrane protein [Niastella]|uniref:RagB/SusD family nutrient uptake outer membrane protein n=1 Tax=Niastella soli TaxID=2821487 RepID=A0ABS3YXL9_9BACT|nr:RagB/SusD family nutrient uptake outer membrane protein [Niastella soli]MBO9202498.1 RagB/SusD family nutrient uptake outer membrane protein [Niastella soli]